MINFLLGWTMSTFIAYAILSFTGNLSTKNDYISVVIVTFIANAVLKLIGAI